MVSGQIKAGAVILAAGLSTRFGGRPKALADFGGRPLLQSAVECFQLCGLTQITVVTGHGHHEVAALADKLGAKPVFNRDYQQGMFSSVQTGVKVMAGREAFFILPVDAALVQPHTILSLLTAWRAIGRGRKTASILVPVCQGRTGHPPFIGGRHLESILGWSGSGGLRGWLASLLPWEMGQKFMHYQAGIIQPNKDRSNQVGNNRPHSATAAGPVVFWEGSDEGLLCDLDTPMELASARPPLGRDRPTLAEAGQLPLQLGLKQVKIRHCRLVAGGAFRLSQGLLAAGLEADPELAFLAGLLHDARYGQKKHARAGRLMCESLGWPKLALAVGAHTDPPPAVLTFLGDSFARYGQGYGEEDEVVYRNISPSTAHTALSVYLADKYWQDDRPVNLAERFGATRDYLSRIPMADQPEAMKSVWRREKVAKAVETWFRTVLGADPAETVHQNGTDEREKTLARFTGAAR